MIFFFKKLISKIEDWCSPFFYCLMILLAILSISFCSVVIEYLLLGKDLPTRDFFSILKLVLVDLKETFVFNGTLKILFG